MVYSNCHQCCQTSVNGIKLPHDVIKVFPATHNFAIRIRILNSQMPLNIQRTNLDLMIQTQTSSECLYVVTIEKVTYKRKFV